MTRRAIRENIFLIVFKAEFNTEEEMAEQIGYTIDGITNKEEDAEDKPVPEPGKVQEEDLTYIEEKATKILALIPELDERIEEISDGWKKNRIGKTELAILRVAIYEMLYDEEVPYKVAINEAVEIAKKYCNPDASGFVNALLAKVKES